MPALHRAGQVPGGSAKLWSGEKARGLRQGTEVGGGGGGGEGKGGGGGRGGGLGGGGGGGGGGRDRWAG